MARFREIALGTTLRKEVDIPLAGQRPEWSAQDVPGAPTERLVAAVRALTSDELADARTAAREYAEAHGVTDPKPGDETHDEALRAFVVAAAYLDPEVKDSDVPFFDGGAWLLSSRVLLPDTVLYLYDAWESWQERCSPMVARLGAEDLFAHVVRIATAEDERPFVQLRPGLRWILLRTLAAQYLSSPTPRSLFGSVSAPSTPAAKPPPSPPPAAPPSPSP